MDTAAKVDSVGWMGLEGTMISIATAASLDHYQTGRDQRAIRTVSSH